MRISLEWVRDFVDLPDVGVADLARELTLKTVEVEDYVDLGASLAHVVVSQITALEPSGGSLVATCDVGSGEHVAVATRTSGLSVGAITAVALPGARLGGSGDVSVERAVTPAEIAGIMSGGVICTAADLRLQRLFPRDSAGQALNLAEVGAANGTPVSDALHWNDFVLEIDNKSLTNRPDLSGHYGIARELAAVYGRKLKPLVGARRPTSVEGFVGDLDVALCRRMTVVEFFLDHAEVAPLWLRSRLARIGEGTVDLCVDLTNYVMFTVGQPAHVYDADRIALPLAVSQCGSITEFELLNGENRKLELSTPVVLDAKAPVGVAGIIGGASSAVSSSSRRFALEVAAFRPQVIRRASQRLGIRTEASTRFEKGLDTQRVDEAVDLFLNLLGELAPAAVITGMQDVELERTIPNQIELNFGFITKLIGQELDAAEVCGTLQSLGFAVKVVGAQLQVKAPTWRSTGDISLPCDIVEEVARIHGYDNIPIAPLSVTVTPLSSQNRRPLDRQVREQLTSRAGMQEVLTYPWVGDRLLHATGLSKEETLRFEGAPAPDRDSLRPSLIPNLLEAVVANLRFAESFSIFEVGTVFDAGALVPFRDVFEPLPRQPLMLAAALVGADGAALFRKAKGVLEMLRRYCHLTDLQFSDSDSDSAPWADRSARLVLTADGTKVGALGLLSTRGRRLAGIENVHVACLDLELGGLSMFTSRENRFQPLPELPGSTFDLSIVVPDSTRWREISIAVAKVNELVSNVSFIDEFRGTWVPEGHKSVTLRVALQPTTATLVADEISATRGEILEALERKVDAHLRE